MSNSSPSKEAADEGWERISSPVDAGGRSSDASTSSTKLRSSLFSFSPSFVSIMGGRTPSPTPSTGGPVSHPASLTLSPRDSSDSKLQEAFNSKVEECSKLRQRLERVEDNQRALEAANEQLKALVAKSDQSTKQAEDALKKEREKTRMLEVSVKETRAGIAAVATGDQAGELMRLHDRIAELETALVQAEGERDAYKDDADDAYKSLVGYQKDLNDQKQRMEALRHQVQDALDDKAAALRERDEAQKEVESWKQKLELRELEWDALQEECERLVQEKEEMEREKADSVRLRREEMARKLQLQRALEDQRMLMREKEKELSDQVQKNMSNAIVVVTSRMARQATARGNEKLKQQVEELQQKLQSLQDQLHVEEQEEADSSQGNPIQAMSDAMERKNMELSERDAELADLRAELQVQGSRAKAEELGEAARLGSKVASLQEQLKVVRLEKEQCFESTRDTVARLESEVAGLQEQLNALRLEKEQAEVQLAASKGSGGFGVGQWDSVSAADAGVGALALGDKEQEIRELKEELADARRECDSLKEQLASASASAEALAANAVTSRGGAGSSSASAGRVAELEAELAEKEKEIDRLRQETEQWDASYSESERRVASLENTVNQLLTKGEDAQTRAVAEVKSRLEEVEAELQATKGHREQLQQELDELREAWAGQERELAEKRGVLDSLEAERQGLQTRLDDVASLETMAGLLQSKIRLKEAENEKLRKDIAVLEIDFKKSELTVESFRQQLDSSSSASRDVPNVRVELMTAQQEIRRLELQIDQVKLMHAQQVEDLTTKIRELEGNKVMQVADLGRAEERNKKVEAAEAALAASEGQLAGARAQVLQVTAELEAYRARAEEAQHKAAELEEALHQLRSQFSHVEDEKQKTSGAWQARFAELQAVAERERQRVAQAESRADSLAKEVQAAVQANEFLKGNAMSSLQEVQVLEELVQGVETFDMRKQPHHRLRLLQHNFTCSACRMQGSGWAWRCVEHHCPDSVHVNCLTGRRLH